MSEERRFLLPRYEHVQRHGTLYIERLPEPHVNCETQFLPCAFLLLSVILVR